MGLVAAIVVAAFAFATVAAAQDNSLHARYEATLDAAISSPAMGAWGISGVAKSFKRHVKSILTPPAGPPNKH
jgi:hypothetical protein